MKQVCKVRLVIGHIIPYYMIIPCSYQSVLVTQSFIPGSDQTLFIDFDSVYAKFVRTSQFDESKPNITSKIFAYIDYLTGVLKPLQTWVSLGGSMPCAILSHERKKRYLASFDCLHTGTELHAYVRSSICRYISARKGVQQIEGDGESGMKIIRRIIGLNTSCIIYHANADMFDLSITSVRAQYITLMHDDEDNKMSHVEVQRLICDIHTKYRVTPLEFVLISSLLGNRIIPPLMYFKSMPDKMDKLVAAFHATKIAYGSIVDNGHIHSIFLKHMLHHACLDEDRGMRDAFSGCSKNMTNREIDPFTPGWMPRYYTALFPDSVCVSDICSAYVNGLDWLLQYHRVPDDVAMSWWYPYIYPPTIFDLCNNLTEIRFKPVSRNYDILVTNNQFQLLLMLPPRDVKLLSKAAQRLMTDVSFRCVHFYPHKFAVSTFMDECQPVLPQFNLKLFTTVGRPVK